MTTHFKSWSVRLPAVIAVLAALALPVPAPAATPPDTLVIAKNIDDIISLDPAEVYEYSGGELVNNIYDRLFTYEPGDFTKLVGDVVESWTIADDGRAFIFRIRPGLTFHSGRPVTAGDAAFSLQRVVQLGKTPAFILTQFGWTKDNVAERVTAKDPQTLSIAIDKSYAPSFVLTALSAAVASVVDREEVLAHQADGDLGSAWLKNHSAGSGAYRLVNWKPNESVTLEANPQFHHGAPPLKRVVLRHVPEAASQLLLLQKGDTDIARDLTPDQVKTAGADAALALASSPKTNIQYLGLNQSVAALAIPKVRQAIRWAIDYQGIAAHLLKGQFIVHQAFWGRGSGGSLDDTPFHLDIAKAKALLAEAGYPNGFALSLDTASSSPDTEIAQSLQSTFAQAGITLTLIPSEKKQLFTKYRARQHAAVLVPWSPDYLDIHSTADFFTRNADDSDTAAAKNAAWRNHWLIPELTQETDAALLESDPAKRAARYLELQRKVQADSPYVVLFQQIEQIALRRDVKSFVLGPSWDTPVYWQASK